MMLFVLLMNQLRFGFLSKGNTFRHLYRPNGFYNFLFSLFRFHFLLFRFYDGSFIFITYILLDIWLRFDLLLWLFNREKQKFYNFNHSKSDLAFY